MSNGQDENKGEQRKLLDAFDDCIKYSVREKSQGYLALTEDSKRLDSIERHLVKLTSGLELLSRLLRIDIDKSMP